ncbi:ATP-binding cassette sub-family A member 13-like [Pipra filicauda]|uniref:ATP-binding cassette sub-family A member 13-like n=1 Tax=Pipra filicauda TaxID=649802 RepID=A0A7R5KB02_9PASS|nr:ATP-binding cassette sub-family A member 13-like [Pipra filicauda]
MSSQTPVPPSTWAKQLCKDCNPVISQMPFFGHSVDAFLIQAQIYLIQWHYFPTEQLPGALSWLPSGIALSPEVLSLAEILWPCVLFLILAAIRFQEPPKYKENCYLEARDLPGRGLYPFMRTLFCNVGSRCKNTSYRAQENNHFRSISIN